MPETKQGSAPAAPAAEPLSAILAEFRAFALRAAGEGRTICPESVLLLADKAEAAAEREARTREQAAADYALKRGEEIHADRCRNCTARERAAGSAAALREALENVERVARFCAETPRNTPGYPTDAARADALYSRIAELGRIARAALRAPARNCDVGTTEEQAERFIEFCKGHLCDHCPISLTKRCGVGWSQMPYVPAEGGAK